MLVIYERVWIPLGNKLNLDCLEFGGWKPAQVPSGPLWVVATPENVPSKGGSQD